jgi:hypothetical protein
MEHARAFDHPVALAKPSTKKDIIGTRNCSTGCPELAAQSMARFGSQNATSGGLETLRTIATDLPDQGK